MKKIILGILVAAAFLLVSGCMIPGMTAADRLDQFYSDINNNPTNAYTNFHPTTSFRQQAALPDALLAYFPAGSTYSVISQTTNAITVTHNDGTVNYTATFTFQIDTGSAASDDFYIFAIGIDGNTFP